MGIAALVLAATPAVALAQDTNPQEPVTNRDVTAVDVATTPITDLGLRKGEIPQVLLAAQANPYDLTGMTACAAISAEIARFDAVLGDDLDLPQVKGSAISPGRVAQAAVGSFIPFRGLIREISGANAHERKLQAAIYAGGLRRAFLKGVGQQGGCPYPARVATPDIAAQLLAARQAAKAAAQKDAKRGKSN
jgi:hypothetical protein